MARERTKQAEVESKPEPEVRAYAVIPVKGGLWSCRTYAIQGDRILAYEDSEPDALPETLALVLDGVEEGR